MDYPTIIYCNAPRYNRNKRLKQHRTMKHFASLTIAALFSMVIIACNGNKVVNEKNLCGTIDSTDVAVGEAPEAVKKVMNADTDSTLFETVLDDTSNGIKVLSLMRCGEDISSEGYGVVVCRNGVKTMLPDVRHGRMPQACYDAESGVLWFVGADSEGTGVQADRLYKLRFNDKGEAFLVASISPYAMQQELLKRLTYSTCGEQIILYTHHEPTDTVTNTVSDMGGFDDDALWIGEQITYDINEKSPVVKFTPGVKFVTGLVLTYDDMPTLSAHIDLSDDGTFTVE